MRAMILAAGLGTRLRPLTLERPKPAVPYGHRPIACVALDVLADLGIQDVVVNTHHLGELLPALLEPFVPQGLSIRYLHEPRLLGTGGGIRNARSLLDDGDPVLILNSDIVFEPDLRRAIALHEKLDSIATMVLRPDPQAEAFGAIDINARGQVRRLLGKPAASEELQRFMFTGVHVLASRALDELPESGCIVQNCYRRWVDEGVEVGGCVDESPWTDIGTLRRYLDAHVALVGADNSISDAADVHSAASLEQCVIGAGASVARCRLMRCVVWPGATVEGDLTDAIVTPASTVCVSG